MEVKGYKIEPGADLAGADLRMTDLSGADLSGANLTGAELCAPKIGRDYIPMDFHSASYKAKMARGANLTDANLTGADLTGANLYQTNFKGSNLRNANLLDVKGVDRKIRRAIEKSGGTPTTSSSPKQESFDLFEQLFGFVGTVAGLFLDYIVVTESDVRVHWVALLGIPLGLTALGWSFGRLFDRAINMWRGTSMSPPPWDPT